MPEFFDHFSTQPLWIQPHFSAAFVARDCGDTGPDGERRFDFVYTHDRDAVIAAARSFMHHLESGPVAR